MHTCNNLQQRYLAALRLTDNEAILADLIDQLAINGCGLPETDMTSDSGGGPNVPPPRD